MRAAREGEGEAARLTSLDTATINPRTLAVLQLRALQDIAASDNAKVVVPYEATSLMGAAEVLLSTLRSGTPNPKGLDPTSNGDTSARQPV